MTPKDYERIAKVIDHIGHVGAFHLPRPIWPKDFAKALADEFAARSTKFDRHKFYHDAHIE
jgi:hypothetical protein